MYFKTSLLVASIAFTALTQSAVAQDALGFALEPVWETKGFSMPESVVAIPGHNWLYVSNVNGEDEAGFISRVGLDGQIDVLKWVKGIMVPTGMAAHDGYLYVVDQKQVHRIDIARGEIAQTYVSASATSLNDIDISDDGRVFVSELQGGAVHTIEGDAVVPWIKSDAFPFPNGVQVAGDYLLVGNVGLELSREIAPDKYGSIFKVSLADKAIQLLPASEKLGTWDGLAPFAEGFVASSPFSDEIWYFTETDKSLIGKVAGGIADIGTDAQAGIVYAPLLFAGKVTALQLAPFTWSRVTTADGFTAKVADQYFGDEGGQSIAKSDGTISGTFGGQKLSGTWEWKDGYFCRTSTLGEMDLGSDCLVIEVTRNQMRLTLNEGHGPSVIYDRK